MNKKILLLLFIVLLIPLVVANETIIIQVDNFYTSEPIENALVEAMVLGWNYEYNTTTDSDGVATFDVPDNSATSIQVSKYAHSTQWFGYVSPFEGNYIQGTLTPYYLYKRVSNENLEIEFYIIGNKPNVTYHKNERMNSFIKVKNVGTQDLEFDSDVKLTLEYFYENNTALDWGKNEQTADVTIHPEGYFYVETIGDDSKMCASGAYAQGIEIDLGSKICMTTSALDKNIIPDDLHGLFYGKAIAGYKVGGEIKNVELVTDYFKIENQDILWDIILPKLDLRLLEMDGVFDIIVRATDNISIINIINLYTPHVGSSIGNIVTLHSVDMTDVYNLALMEEVVFIELSTINYPNIDLQEVLDTINVEITLREETTEINITEDFEGTSLDVSEIYGFEYNNLTTFELFNNINFELEFNKENDDWVINVNSLNITNQDVESLINFIFINLDLNKTVADYELNPSQLNQLINFEFDAACESGTFKKEGISMDIHLDCGLNDMNSLEDFEEQTLSVLGFVNPTILNEFLFNYTNTTFNYDFNITTNLDGLDFDLNEGVYDVVFNYEDNQGNNGTEIVRVNIIYEDDEEEEDDDDDEPSSSGGGGPTSQESDVKQYDITDFSSRIISLTEGEHIEFIIKGIVRNQKHKFKVLSIKEDYVNVEINSNLIRFKIGVGEIKYFDIDGDGKDDLKVLLISLTFKPDNKKGSKVFFEITQIEEEPATIDSDEPDEPVIPGPQDKPKRTLALIFLIIASIFLIVILIVVANKKKINKEYGYGEEDGGEKND